MLQRVQTLYLLLAEIVIVMMLVWPLGNFMASDGTEFRYLFYGIYSNDGTLFLNTYPVAIILVSILLIVVTGIFLYKKRVLQMRLCIYNIILMIGSLGLIWYYSRQAGKALDTEFHFSVTAVMPLIAAILTYLAFRGIRKDELLIRSIDRIR